MTGPKVVERIQVVSGPQPGGGRTPC